MQQAILLLSYNAHTHKKSLYDNSIHKSIYDCKNLMPENNKKKNKLNLKLFFHPIFFLENAAKIFNKFYFIFIVQSVRAQKCNKNVFFLLFSLWNEFFFRFLNWITFLFPSIWSLTLLKAFQSTGYYISIKMYVHCVRKKECNYETLDL